MIKDPEELTRIKTIFRILKKEYPNTKPQLIYSNPFELLIATILSAQCTDARVNIVTKELFIKYKKPKDFLLAEPEEIESAIYSTGFYRQKTKSIIACCRKLVDEYNSKVPSDFELLTKLPGVGRKTASVVAGHGFGIPAIAVDTHVKRISNLLGIVNSQNPEKIEIELKNLLPKKDWIDSTHWFINHGRKVCIARRPKCEKCVIANYCKTFKNMRNMNGKR